MSARAVLAALLAGCAPAQDDVVVHCVLPPGALALVRTHLERTLAQTARVHVTAREPLDLVADLRRGGGVLPVDVAFGLDACWFAQLAGEGVLAPYASAGAAALAPGCRGGDLFVVPVVSPWRLAFDASFQPRQEASAPTDHDDLLHGGDVRGLLVVLAPRARPSLFAGWMQREVRRGGEAHALAWLRTLDAQVRAYAPDVQAAQAALADRSLFVLVPAFELWDDMHLRPVDVAPGLPWFGLGLALGRQGHAVAAARAVYDELAGELLARALAGVGLQPAPRAAVTSRPASATAPADFVGDFDVRNVPLERWLSLWENEVRGRGAYSADLALVLDLVFGAAFLVFLWFVWRRVRTEP